MSERNVFKKIKEDSNFNLSNLIFNKDYLNIFFDNENIKNKEEIPFISILPSSFFKIFKFLNLSSSKFEDLLYKFITVTVIEDDDENNDEIELDPVYINILNKTNLFYISFGNFELTLNTYNKNKSVSINSFSLNKIAKKLGKNIIGISDFINIGIMILPYDEIQKRIDFMSKLNIKTKIFEFAEKNAKKIFEKKKTIKNNNNNNNNSENIFMFTPDMEIVIRDDKKYIEKLFNFTENAQNFIKGLPQKKFIKKPKPFLLYKNNNLYNTNTINNPIVLSRISLSRRKFSRKKSMHFDSLKSAHQNSRKKSNNKNNITNDFKEMSFDIATDSYDYSDIINNLKESDPKNNNNIKLKNNNNNNNNNNNLIYLIIKDINQENKIINKKNFFYLLSTFNDINNRNKIMSVFDYNNKIIQINYENLKQCNENYEKNNLILCKDLKGKNVFINKHKLKALFNNENNIDNEKEYYEIFDYLGNKTVIKFNKNNLNILYNNPFVKSKKLFFIRLARIEEINEEN